VRLESLYYNRSAAVAAAVCLQKSTDSSSSNDCSSRVRFQRQRATANNFACLGLSLLLGRIVHTSVAAVRRFPNGRTTPFFKISLGLGLGSWVMVKVTIFLYVVILATKK
jgi:hypothetical protein